MVLTAHISLNNHPAMLHWLAVIQTKVPLTWTTAQAHHFKAESWYDLGLANQHVTAVYHVICSELYQLLLFHNTLM